MIEFSDPPRVLAEIRKGQAVIKCPFCGKEHFHGAVAGHRASHCSSPRPVNPGYEIILPNEADND
ncbi:MAG TPA: hypothetical protein VJL35_00715 [Gemmatimonadaceae bacterium]|nr:hypothetical protein [Gemmatimonadaceae bacterium]